jgi:hypothetical protein
MWQLAQQQQRPSDSGELKKSLLFTRHCEEPDTGRSFATLLVDPITADAPDVGGAELVVELDSEPLVML